MPHKYSNYTISALELIGLELFREEVYPTDRELIAGTMSYRNYRKAYPDTDVDVDFSGNPEQFLTTGEVLYHHEANDHGGYTVVRPDGTERHYSQLRMYLSKDEDCPNFMTIGFTTLPGWDQERNSINLLDVPEEKVSAILAAHPEVPVYPEPVRQRRLRLFRKT